MKVAFITSGAENIGLEYLSSNLKKTGHDVKLFYDSEIFSGRFFFIVKFCIEYLIYKIL